jgi:hypothetical protein
MYSLVTLENNSASRRRDTRVAIAVLLASWALFAALEQSPFKLQGAVLESLVERGRLHFVRGHMKDIVFENFDTKTPSFRYLFNIFPHGGVYYVNHAPGQFLLAAPWYAAAVKLGWRFETDERLVWRWLVWLLTAPLGALGVMCVFILARRWGAPWQPALVTSIVLALCSPWWAASGVLYHDSLAVALILIGGTVWVCQPAQGFGVVLRPFVAGLLLSYSVVTTYLVLPVVLLICFFILAAGPSRRETVLFASGFLPTLAILPIANMMSFGSFWATGYSAGGFDKNYPSPFDVFNTWEKTGFYLWHAEYGLLSLFPVFLMGALGLVLWRPADPSVRKLLLTLAVGHFLFIITMEHHGSVGWGMGRFFLPLYAVLVFGLMAIWQLEGWKGSVARALVFGSMLYSAVFAALGAWYGLQGVMEPGVPSLKLRFIFANYEYYQMLFLSSLIVGATGELAYQWFGTPSLQTTEGAAVKSSPGVSQASSKSRPVKHSRRNRRRR